MNYRPLYLYWNGEPRSYPELCTLLQILPNGPEREALKALLFAYDYKAGPETLVKTLLQLGQGNKMDKGQAEELVRKTRFKYAKLFTWEGVPKTLEELRWIKDNVKMPVNNLAVLSGIIAKFDEILGTGTKPTATTGADKIMENPTGQQAEQAVTRKTINFRDYIMQPTQVVDTDVLVNMDDFRVLAEHYSFFLTLEPRMKFRIQKEKVKAKIAAEQEKIRENCCHNRAQMQDALAYGNLNLSYSQWKQRGRFVRQGEKSGIYTMDGNNTSYALFHFTQTDVAENRYKTIKPRCENNQTCTCIDGCEDKR